MSETRISPAEAAPYLIDERTAARRLSVSVSTMANLRKRGMPHKRLGNRVLYDPDALREWAKNVVEVAGRRAKEPIGSR